MAPDRSPKPRKTEQEQCNPRAAPKMLGIQPVTAGNPNAERILSLWCIKYTAKSKQQEVHFSSPESLVISQQICGGKAQD